MAKVLLSQDLAGSLHMGSPTGPTLMEQGRVTPDGKCLCDVPEEVAEDIAMCEQSMGLNTDDAFMFLMMVHGRLDTQ